jgi:hypothetical protein
MSNETNALTLEDRPPLAPVTHESFAVAHLPISLQIFFDDNLFRRCQTVANYLAKAEGIAPRHLIGKPEACFAVVSRALAWRLDPYATAAACYATPSGQVGFYGSLCQAIIENSGRLIGGVKFEHYGDWAKLRGKFKIATSDKGTKFPVANWRPEDEDGLGVMVSARLRDEELPREMPFDLVQAYPRNSTLWATDPRTQIIYTSVRRFATSTVPTLFMGVPFDREEMSDWVSGLTDVTPPRPELGDFTESGERRRRPSRAKPASEGSTAEPAAEDHPDSVAAANGSAELAAAEVKSKPWFFSDEYGEVFEFEDVDEAVTGYAGLLDAARNNLQALEAVWQNGARLLSALRERGNNEAADALNAEYGRLLEEAQRASAAAKPATAATGVPAAATAEGPAATEAESRGGMSTGSSPAYDVAVPLPDGMQMNSWHMAARAKLKEMTEAQRPPVDFTRFREANSVALARLKDGLLSWHNMLIREIDKGIAR